MAKFQRDPQYAGLSDYEYLLTKVEQGSECHIWMASKTKQGYGNFYADGKNWMAHRYVWTYHNGEIPKGMVIRHTCDNPSCVNPAHLLLGTYRDNTVDMDTRGRRVDRYTYKEKGTPPIKDTSEIERLHEAGFKPSAIAMITGTPEYLVHAIVS